jgi:hypothetical protein
MKTLVVWIGVMLLFTLSTANATGSSMSVPCYPPSYLLFRQGTGDWIENANYYIPLVDQFRANVHDIIKNGDLPNFQDLMDYEALTCYESHKNYSVYSGQAAGYPSKHYVKGMRYAYEAIGTLLFVVRGDFDNESVKYREHEITTGDKRLDKAFEEFALIEWEGRIN